MPKISRAGGPSIEPVHDAEGNEIVAGVRQGPPEQDDEREGDDLSAGTNSSASEQTSEPTPAKPKPTDARPKPARTTGSR